MTVVFSTVVRILRDFLPSDQMRVNRKDSTLIARLCATWLRNSIFSRLGPITSKNYEKEKRVEV